MTERHVAILGEVRIDEVRDPAGVREIVAGEAVELALALRGHGLVVTIIAPVGEDPDGDRIRAVLQSDGVHLVAIPATGTVRRSVVRDRSGTQIERRTGEAVFADTRRSLAVQAEADVIVDLRGERLGTVEQDRDDVLRTLGVLVPANASEDEAAAAEDPLSAEIPEASAADRSASAERAGLLPAPIVAGTFRHGPVRLLPPAPDAHEPAPDWHGLEPRIARIAT